MKSSDAMIRKEKVLSSHIFVPISTVEKSNLSYIWNGCWPFHFSHTKWM